MKRIITPLRNPTIGPKKRGKLSIPIITTYFDTKEQWTATFACNQLIWVMWAFEYESICSFQMPDNFYDNLTKADRLFT